MGLTRRDILADRACRVMLKDRRYTRQRTRALIEWLHSDWEPTSDVAGRALEAIGGIAFDDLLESATSQAALPRPNVVWALGLFPARHDELLPVLRKWLSCSTGDLKRQVAVSIAHILTERLRRQLPIQEEDVAAFRVVLDPEIAQGAIEIHLRDFERAAAKAGWRSY